MVLLTTLQQELRLLGGKLAFLAIPLPLLGKKKMTYASPRGRGSDHHAHDFLEEPDFPTLVVRLYTKYQ